MLRQGHTFSFSLSLLSCLRAVRPFVAEEENAVSMSVVSVCVLGTSQATNVHMIGCACAMIGCVRAMVPWICFLPRLLLSRGLFVCECVW